MPEVNANGNPVAVLSGGAATGYRVLALPTAGLSFPHFDLQNFLSFRATELFDARITEEGDLLLA